MSNRRRRVEADELETIRKDLKWFWEIQELIRDRVSKRMKDDELTYVDVARATDLKSPSRVREFMEEGRSFIEGKSLESIMAFAKLTPPTESGGTGNTNTNADSNGNGEEDYLQEVIKLSGKYGRLVAMATFGNPGIDLYVDLSIAWKQQGKSLSGEVFAKIFAPYEEEVLRLLNFRLSGLKDIMTNEDRKKAILAILDDPAVLAEGVSNQARLALEEHKALIAELDSYRLAHPELGKFNRELADVLGIGETTVSKALRFNESFVSNSSIQNVMRKVREYIRSKPTHATSVAVRPSVPAKNTGRQTKTSPQKQVPKKEKVIPSESRIPRLTKEDLRTLEIEDQQALIRITLVLAERLGLCLTQLIRATDEGVIDNARAQLGTPLSEVYRLMEVFTLDIELEPLLQMIEEERAMNSSLTTK